MISDVLSSMRFVSFIVACVHIHVEVDVQSWKPETAGIYVKVMVQDVISHDHVYSVSTVC